MPITQIVDLMKDITTVLKSTYSPDDNVSKCFFYETTRDLMKAQKILLDVANHFVQNCDLVDFEYRSYYYNVMTLLFLRGEFSIENLRIRRSKDGNFYNLSKKYRSL